MLCYDLNQFEPSRSYDVVRTFIERHAISWRRPLMSQWFVETCDTPEAWADALKLFTDENDRYFVCRIHTGMSDFAGYLDKEICDWLRSRCR
ncbi:hypothetical protein D187_008724 [Cystobacter fuscus DSM 2262]|uniref:Uncharacterized protein n=1 Tax=Cystobacter fuscus (strain ATCC 25194 / DSM 2262 / NBRC 100088 / M29) TaxID=1242864 RepID=S9PHK5_CYSF2|nr:hypothetical protein D187_008724 [Cystobacter fuscus DSM 2262]